MDMKLVAGETIALLVGGIAYLALIVRAGVWDYNETTSNIIKRDFFIALICSALFAGAFCVMAMRVGSANVYKITVAIFFVIFVISYIVLKVLASISAKHTQ